MQFTQNNWFEWYYDDELFGRQDLENFKKYSTFFNCKIDSISSFVEETQKTAQHTVDLYGKDLTLCFSGGMDSEVVLRSYLDIGHPIKVVIYRYENDINEYDIRHAKMVCEQLNTPYTIIDFNVEEFFKTDALDMVEACQIDNPLELISCKFLEMTDGIPILGEGDPFVVMRPANSENDKPNYYWAVTEFSTGIAREQYMRHINKQAIPAWLQWRPEVMLAYLESDYTQKLITNQYKNIYSCLDNKYDQYVMFYPDIINRKKVSGFENIPAEFFTHVNKTIIDVRGLRMKFMQPYDRTVKQAINELRGVSRLSK